MNFQHFKVGIFVFCVRVDASNYLKYSVHGQLIIYLFNVRLYALQLYSISL